MQVVRGRGEYWGGEAGGGQGSGMLAERDADALVEQRVGSRRRKGWVVTGSRGQGRQRAEERKRCKGGRDAGYKKQ